MKIRSIAVSGEAGSGTSTLAKNLSKMLGFKYLNTGDFIRNWYQQNNIPLEEVNKIPEELDRKIDANSKRKMKSESGVVFEARLAGWLAQKVKGVFKVLVVADLEIRAQRVAKRDNLSLDEARQRIILRSVGLKKKFKKLYGVEDYLDPLFFDLVVDSDKLDKEECLEEVLSKIKE